MYGNFITLTNSSEKDIEKIIKYRLEPLYVSIHALDPGLRNIIFRNTEHQKGLLNLQRLDKADIGTNIQIVLVSGLNDGQNLINTLEGLVKNYKNIISIGIVPAGITRYNKENMLKPFTKSMVNNTIEIVDKFNKDHHRHNGKKMVFMSDEFYIIAGTELPLYESYGDFNQIKNGIGKTTDFLFHIQNYLKEVDCNVNSLPEKELKSLMVSSEYGTIVLEKAIKTIIKSSPENSRIKKAAANIKILTVRNDFLGGNVKVTGLLAGCDIINSLKKNDISIYSDIFIPDCIFNDDGFSIDNLSRDNIMDTYSSIKLVDENSKSFIYCLAGR
jgi:putative radical SAM enzyme (TIGR03279 family)